MRRPRALHGAAAIMAAFALALVTAVPAHAADVTYSSVLDGSSPTWNRVLNCGTVSGVGTNVSYHAQRFTVDATGSYVLEMVSTTLPDGDGHFTLYSGSFNPAAPLTNCIGVDDDSGTGFMPRLNLVLTSGTVYVLVTSTYANASYGSFTNTISGPGTASFPTTVTVEQAAGQADPTSVAEVEFDVEFSEAVTGLGESAFVIGGTAGATTVTLTGSGTSYVATVTGMTAAGTVTLSLPVGAAQAADGSLNEASTSLDNSVQFSPPAPTVTVEQASGQDDPTSDAEIQFAVEFSAPVTGLDISSFLISGTASSSATSLTGSGASYVLTVTATSAGTVTVTLPGGAATAFGVPNEASTSLDNTITYESGYEGETPGLADSGGGEVPLSLAAALLAAGLLVLGLGRRRRAAQAR